MTTEIIAFLKGYNEHLLVLLIFITAVSGAFTGWVKFREKLNADLKLQQQQAIDREDEQRDKFLKDFEHWYQLAQVAFDEISTLKLKINALTIHVQNLENTIRRHDIDVPERPPLIRETLI